MFPTQVKSSGQNSGPKGKARLNVKKGLATVEMLDGDHVGQKFPNLPLPEGVVTLPSGEYRVTLEKAGDKFFSLVPVFKKKNQLNVKFDRWAGAPGKEPTPKRSPSKFDESRFDETATALLKIYDGDYKGLTISYYLRTDMLVPRPDGLTGLAAGEKGLYKNSEKMLDFLTLFLGIDDPAQLRIPYQANPLPQLYTMLRQADRLVAAIMQPDGFIETFTSTLQPKKTGKR